MSSTVESVGEHWATDMLKVNTDLMGSSCPWQNFDQCQSLNLLDDLVECFCLFCVGMIVEMGKYLKISQHEHNTIKLRRLVSLQKIV